MITDFKKYVKRTSKLYFAYVIHKGFLMPFSADLSKMMKSHKTNKKGIGNHHFQSFSYAWRAFNKPSSVPFAR